MRCLLVAENIADMNVLCAFAQKIGGKYDIILLTGAPETDSGAETIYFASLDEIPPADSLADNLLSLATSYDMVGGVASMFGKDWLARLAGLMNVPMVGDIIEAHGENVYTRPMYAGNVFAKVKVESPKYVFSVRSTAFSNPSKFGASKTEKIDITITGSTKRISKSAKQGGRPDLTQAKVVVSGGRPLKDAETFERLIGGLADALGGAAGATRAAVDSGIAANDLQVGQTGKIVAPELYIAAGVSGSTQHLAGMKDSKVIVAINTDPDAPIFQVADYGLVQDLYVAIPQMLEKLKSS